MGSGMFDGMDILIWFGIVGIIVTLLALVVGVPALIWYLCTHLSWL